MTPYDSDVRRIKFYIDRDGRDVGLNKAAELIKVYRAAALDLKTRRQSRTVVDDKVIISRPGKRNKFYMIYVLAALDHRIIRRNFNSIFQEQQ